MKSERNLSDFIFFVAMKEKKLFTFEEVRQKMVNYCVYQDRCPQEVEQKMREFLLIPEAKDEIFLYIRIARLQIGLKALVCSESYL